ncbi:MAG: hypothetical protein RBU30_26185 [Polyangia bacterium]|jgi:predicted transcriptional regulator of viral defense system|nr:hypothetical protein [Polyangia bacterium]
MKFDELLKLLGNEPLFSTATLLAGDVDPKDIQRQLSRWTKAGRVSMLRRGLYALATPYRKVEPHPYLIANRLWRASYVSCQAALAHYGMIPEAVYAPTSVTTGRPEVIHNSFGRFIARHIHPKLFFGYRLVDLGRGQEAFVALPEKALLDLVHLEPGGDEPAFLRELRLQNLEELDLGRLNDMAVLMMKPKLMRAAGNIARMARELAMETESL